MNTKPYKPYGGRKRKRRWPWVVLSLLIVFLAAFGALEGYIFSQARTAVEGQPPVMVVFGCQVKPEGPSVLLRDRLDTALTYLETHPDTTVVVTGGKGDDEHISEAQCMYDYLTAHGAEGGRILMEPQSRNTWQNILFTQQLLREKGLDSGSYLLVSSDFHLARIRLLWGRAWEKEYTLSTLAAPVSHTPSRLQMFFREPLALVKSFLLDR